MAIYEESKDRKLRELLDLIHTAQMGLPDFQRDFVWDPKATSELIVSIANEYPAGSILRVRCDRDAQPFFKPREFESAPGILNPNYLILDGQQRLTSLYQAFYGKGEFKFYLHLDKLLNGDDFEDSIDYLRTNGKRDRKTIALYDNLRYQTENYILPLEIIFGEVNGFDAWILKASRTIEAMEKKEEFQNQMLELKSKCISKFYDYEFPVSTLPPYVKPEAVCTIFEVLNRTGVKLSVFDLLTARFYPQGIRLRDMWEKSKGEHSDIGEFEVDPYYLLQSISLLDGNECKRGSILKLSEDAVRKLWDSVALAYADTLDIFQGEYGIWIPRWIPYSTMLVPMAALLAKFRDKRGIDFGAVKNYLRRWFWCSVFDKRYEKAPNTSAKTDYDEVIKWIENGEIPKQIVSFEFNTELNDVTPRQKAIYNGMMCLILQNNPRDFFEGKSIPRSLKSERGQIDDHHIFPLGSEPARLNRDVNIDCILNRTLIDQKTNLSISKNPPSRYLLPIKEKLGEQKLNEVLQSHLIPSGSDSPLWNDDLKTMFEMRKDIFYQAIQRVTG